MRCSEIMNQLEELSPVQFADSWDNVGLLVGRNDKNVKKVCIALDPTDEVIEQAILYEADMLITHHPLIFNGMKTITTNHFIGNRIYQLIQNDICYYAMHTNFDVMGMADAAADELGMKQSQVLEISYEDDIAKEGYGRYGKLPYQMSLRECAQEVKERFYLESVRIYGDEDKAVETVAIIPGSGGSMIPAALKAKADVFRSEERRVGKEC